jgi:hypothetical protein
MSPLRSACNDRQIDFLVRQRYKPSLKKTLKVQKKKLSVSVIIPTFATCLDKNMNSLLKINNMMFFNTQNLDVTNNFLEREREREREREIASRARI